MHNILVRILIWIARSSCSLRTEAAYVFLRSCSRKRERERERER